MARRGAAPPVEDLPEEDDVDSNNEQDESEAEESSDGEPIVPLLAGREKRSNAGNRMRALIEDEAEAEVEEMFKEEENDEEFETKEEKDIFDSDFGSTDSGSGGEDDEGEDAGERKLQRETRQARKDARGKKKKAHTPFIPSFARQTKAAARASTSANTLDDDASPGPSKKKRKKEIDPALFVPQRESSRKSAVAFKKTIEGRLKESEQRRASAPKPKVKATISLTQADLISEALETEEINRASLLAFYAAEEDRRALERAAGMRYEIVGPKVTFLSRLEDLPDDYRPVVDVKGKGKGKEIQNDEARGDMESGRRRLIEVIGEAGQVGWSAGQEQGLKAVQEARDKEATVGPNTSDPATSIPTPAPEPSTSTTKIDFSHPLTRLAAANLPPPVVAKPRAPAGTTPGVSRNYLIIEEFEGASHGEEMQALFGEHVDWEKEVVPATRHSLCPISGLPALYRDPTSFTPYATIAAYRTIKSVVDGTYVYSGTLGAFVGQEDRGLVGQVEAARGPAELGSSRRRSSAMGRATSGHALNMPTNPVAQALWEAKQEHERELAAQEQSLATSTAYGQLPPLPPLPQQPHQYSPGPSLNPYERGYASGGASRGSRRSRGGVELEEDTSASSLPLPDPTTTSAAPATSSPGATQAKGRGRNTRARGRQSELAGAALEDDTVMEG